MSRCLAFLSVFFLSMSLGLVPAAASEWRILAQFDDAPEGLVADGKGGFYVSLFHSGHVMQVAKDGTVRKVADLRTVIGPAKGSTVGIDWDGADKLYVAFSEYSKRFPWPAKANLSVEACGDATVTRSGLYAVTLSTGTVEPVVTRADGYPFCFPDDPVIASDGSIYLSDLSLQAIWKIDPKKKSAVLWSKDPLFSPGDKSLSGYPVGVNGIALAADESALFGVTGGIPMLVKVPINADGSAGKAEMLTFGYDNMDGLEVDAEGNFYLTETLRSEIWKVSPDARKREQLGNPLQAPLGAPASLAFGAEDICVTNLNFFKHLPEEKANSIACRKLGAPLW
ncbi:SMP-30/gluconolactonase/LRE family protein [Stappia indica]|uniref:SMP-30/gluconolactonase/LRE family protein n=1 Tax=Stappia indica TaxID=538381 RepID=UPI001CD4CA8C|nr:SMP-30/gluconolactonase/LRE family protein [Stappia indica]MCA1299427.1 SMP-30/gluconolactonase/LRE family protein [Stappia indica]